MDIYIVEDDLNIQEIEKYALTNCGYNVKTFENAEAFYNAINKKIPSLIILDIMLPKESGMSILKTLKLNPDFSKIPIIMVTAKDTELDKVKGLDRGADDYITKPFGIMEFISRVKAVMRRVTPTEETDFLSYKEVSIYPQKYEVLVNNKPIKLTHKEFELLKYMVINKNIVLSRDKIMQNVWGFDYEGETRTVDAHIKTIRKKLKEGCHIIKTIRNIGYKVGE